jgi:maleylacetoacetate isomerase
MIRLYGFWRSLAAYRVRVALHIKGLTFEEETIDLGADAQLASAFRTVNPQAAIPALIIDGAPPLTQSVAIIEYLDEIHADPPLMPRSSVGRARVRSLALMFAADGHPLITPRVTRYLAQAFGADEASRDLWSRHWLRQSLEQAQIRLAGDAATGAFCHGGALTLADICLASQVLGARGFGVELADLPEVRRISDACFDLNAFRLAHPLTVRDAAR